MNIWLIMSGEPLEMFGERPHRVGILSKMLVKQGHNVTWFTTTYDHQSKKYFYSKTVEIKNRFGVNMIFLHSETPYIKNISLSRIKNHQEVSNQFTKVASQEEKPDIILCAFPTIELSYEAIKYGQKYNVPIIIDIRDMWPDVFLDVLPKFLKPLGKLLLNSYYKKTKYIFQNATTLVSMTDEFIKYGLTYGNRKKSELDQSFSFGYVPFTLQEKHEKQAINKFKNVGVDFEKFTICYFGTIGKQFDFSHMIHVAQEVTDIQFVICGNGTEMENLKKETSDLENIILPGWVNQNEIWTLMKYSKAALAPYIHKENFLLNLTNKPIEYLAGGLPILSSINGVLGSLITKNNCGFIYKNSDELKNQILELKNNTNVQNTMSKNAKELFEKNFSAKEVYGKMINYLEIVAKKYQKDKNV
jgi:glycosyltransferase involved in cell wall biosynthesis